MYLCWLYKLLQVVFFNSRKRERWNPRRNCIFIGTKKILLTLFISFGIDSVYAELAKGSFQGKYLTEAGLNLVKFCEKEKIKNLYEIINWICRASLEYRCRSWPKSFFFFFPQWAERQYKKCCQSSELWNVHPLLFCQSFPVQAYNNWHSFMWSWPIHKRWLINNWYL